MVLLDTVVYISCVQLGYCRFDLSTGMLHLCTLILGVLKPGFHYPSSRPELTGDQFPSPVNSASGNARPSTRPVLMGNGNRSTRVVETRLNVYLGYKQIVVGTSPPSKKTISRSLKKSVFCSSCTCIFFLYLGFCLTGSISLIFLKAVA